MTAPKQTGGGSWRGAIKAVTSLESMHQTPLMSVENWNKTVLEELKLNQLFCFRCFSGRSSRSVLGDDLDLVLRSVMRTKD